MAPRWCEVCSVPVVGRARTCSARCRQRLSRWPRSRLIEARWGVPASDLWRTPPWLVEAVRLLLADDGLDLSLDACAFPEDSVAPRWISPEDNGLIVSWVERAEGGVTWWNPPYSSPMPWALKAVSELRLGAASVALVPACTGARWWAELVNPAARISLLRGRVAFLHPDTGRAVSGTRFDSALVWLGCRPLAARVEVIELSDLRRAGERALSLRRSPAIGAGVPPMFPEITTKLNTSEITGAYPRLGDGGG